MQISKETYDLFYAYKNTVNAQSHLSRILESKKVGGKAKNFLTMIQTRLKVNIRDLRLLLPAAEAKIIDEQMLDTEVTMQMQNINDMCAELPKAIRDQVENYIESYHKVYKQKVA